MKDKMIKEGKLLDDDVKLIRHQLLFRKPYGEVIRFMVNQLGLTKSEATSVYEDIAIECHGNKVRREI